MDAYQAIVLLAFFALVAYALHLDRPFEVAARAGIYEFFIKLKNRGKK